MRRIRRTAPLVPQSARLDGTDVAGQHRFYAEVQQARVRSSLLASGVTALVYSLLQSGRPCTCRIQASLLDADGNLSEDGVRSILTDDPIAGHPLSPRGPSKPTLTVADVGLGGLEDAYDSLLGGMEEDEGLPEDTLDRIDSEIDELGELDPESDGAGIIGGMSQDRCGICFGSGFEGGFKLVGGHRTVLTTQSEIDAAATDCRIDSSTGPHRFVGGSRVTFTGVRMPHAPGQRLHELSAWRGDVRLPRSSYVINRDEIAAAAGSPSASDLRLPRDPDRPLGDGGGISVTVEARPGEELDITHVAIQTLRRRVPIDVLQVPDDFHPNLTGSSATATLQLPADAPLSKFSVVRESKYGRAWQASRVTPHLNNRGTAVWHEVEARLVAQHELASRLAW